MDGEINYELLKKYNDTMVTSLKRYSDIASWHDDILEFNVIFKNGLLNTNCNFRYAYYSDGSKGELTYGSNSYN